MPCVLIVDDLPATVRILCNRVKDELGAEVVPVRTLNQAWQRINAAESPFDLMIIDLYLPTDFDKLQQYESKIQPGSFNQGELLGAYAEEQRVPFFYYTSDPTFYRGKRPDQEVVSKGEPVGRVIVRIQQIFAESP